jgi:PAS domain S-box-containing protein
MRKPVGKKPARRRATVRSATAPAAGRLTAREIVEAFLEAPVAAAVADGDRILAVNHPFARALGRAAEACLGARVGDLLPPDGGEVALPAPRRARSYRTHLDGVLVRVDLAGSAAGKRRLVTIILHPVLEDADGAAGRALLALSRELAASRDEDELALALARALDVLFPGRSFCVRLVDAKTLATKAVHARGALRRGARERISLRRAAVRKTGLSEALLAAGGVRVADDDEPVFEGCERATAVPLAVSGDLFGVVNLEYAPGAPGDPEHDEPLLVQVANQAALGVRNLRSLEEVTYLKSYLEDLIENANALIAVVNRTGDVIVFNRALSRLTGRAREDVLGDELAALAPAEERARLARLLARTFEGETQTGVELRLLVAGGGEARVQASTSAIYGASGEVEGVLLIGQDLTLLRALQERAEHAQKLAEIGRLAAGIAHEINNPLTAVTAYAEALVTKHAVGGDAGDVEKLRRILEAGQRIHRFSRDLVAYARPPQQKEELVDVARVLEQAAQMCEPALAAAGAKLERHIESAPPVWGQRSSLVQVFVNLLTNAAHALERGGGTVTLELAPSGDHVAARVKDDGPGMAIDVKRRAFEPFFTTKADGKGAGLGLSIVQGIVSRHGGAISVESTPGAGTAFTVMLPVQPARA